MKLPLFPLRTVLFPGMLLPLHIFEPRYREMINLCVRTDQPFGVVLIRSGVEVGGEAEPHPVGTYARISRVERLPDGRMNIETVGQDRFRILSLSREATYLTGTVEHYPLLEQEAPLARKSVRALLPWLERYLALIGEATHEPFNLERLPPDPVTVAYLAAIVAQIPLEEKQSLLTTSTAAAMLEQERAIYRREVSLLRTMLNSDQSKSSPVFSPN